MKFSEFPQAVVNENVDYTVKEITNVIKKYGPRESGSENCLDAEKHLKKELDQFSDETHFESYKIAPKAFLHFTKTISFCIILSILLCVSLTFLNVITFFIAECIVGGVVGVSLIITAFEFLFYKQLCDLFYKKTEGHNLVATRKPKGEVKKRIIISGHIDAAYEWQPIRVGGGKCLLAVLFSAVAFGILSFIVALINVIANFTDMGAFGSFMLDYSYYFHFLTAISMVGLFNFVDFKTISPGANDNLTGTYAAVTALRMLDMAGVELENTEVVCMVNDGEEAGLRGANAFAKAHKDEYKNDGVKTAALCVDTLTDEEYLCVYSKDMTGTVKHDKEFSELVLNSSKEAGNADCKFSNVYFGASDAAAFTKNGYVATCLAEMDPTPADYYHNRRDTADRLNKNAIKNGYNTVISTILAFDEKD